MPPTHGIAWELHALRLPCGFAALDACFSAAVDEEWPCRQLRDGGRRRCAARRGGVPRAASCRIDPRSAPPHACTHCVRTHWPQHATVCAGRQRHWAARPLDLNEEGARWHSTASLVPCLGLQGLRHSPAPARACLALECAADLYRRLCDSDAHCRHGSHCHRCCHLPTAACAHQPQASAHRQVHRRAVGAVPAVCARGPRRGACARCRGALVRNRAREYDRVQPSTVECQWHRKWWP